LPGAGNFVGLSIPQVLATELGYADEVRLGQVLTAWPAPKKKHEQLAFIFLMRVLG
jgi:hypothetical protein